MLLHDRSKSGIGGGKIQCKEHIEEAIREERVAGPLRDKAVTWDKHCQVLHQGSDTRGERDIAAPARQRIPPVAQYDGSAPPRRCAKGHVISRPPVRPLGR